jgi:predicted molibdopterin-dependent oxidoreductase YjgC
MRITEHPVLVFEKGKMVKFQFEGNDIWGCEGEPIAAALVAAGVRVLSHSPTLGRARGFFCAIGNCSSCLMTVDDEPNVRVCTEKLREGMVVRRQTGKGALPVVRPEGGSDGA